MCPTCSVIGCSNVPPMPGISFHSFPKDPRRRRLWVIALKRDRWEPRGSNQVCSAHFTVEDYVHDPSIALRMGMKPFSRLLKRDAVPSVFEHDRKANKLRGPFVKRRRKEVIEEALAAYASLSPAARRHKSRLCEKHKKSKVSIGSNTCHLTRNQGLMTERPLLRNTGVQTLK
ncbi:peroxynitrite isomerase THAP4 [Rhipicephalus sanguineus]|uniref:peroxynitrite isomerase THAP4 n=1 Tax=Rhipicephalus sanguineus TaxID=34632 RepID=UPI0018959DFE|nr:peroxynitrite isomerase THAP4 [Rhipicephalus sanguineus]